MPSDALLISLAVTVVFVGFALVLAWADHWTGQKTGAGTQTEMPKRRSF